MLATYPQRVQKQQKITHRGRNKRGKMLTTGHHEKGIRVLQPPTHPKFLKLESWEIRAARPRAPRTTLPASLRLSSAGAGVGDPGTLTWLQHPDLQQVGGPLGQPRPAVVVVPPPQLCHTLVLARLRVAGPADAQPDVVAGFSLFDGRSGPEAGGSVPPLDSSIPGKGHQVMELGGAHWLEPPRH